MAYKFKNVLIPQRFWESRLHPDDKSRILTSMNAFFANGMDVKWEEEYRFRKFNGEYAHVHDRGHLVYNGDNRTSLMIGATQDISVIGMVQGSIISGIGLRNVKARVAVLNGEAIVNSSKDEGFTLEIRVPLRNSSGV